MLFSLVTMAIIAFCSAQSPRVTVNEGTLVGKTVTFSEDKFINKTRDIDIFLGVPYAAPPVRFAEPEPMPSWDGERNATEFSALCQQTLFPLFPPAERMSEDCLHLNVFAPNPKPSGAAVMVWIHGGGFVFGSAMAYDTYGVPLVAVGDVIIVSINYRLSVFSFFSTDDPVAPGNFGMLDQAAAIKWVYDNIEAFGGDKERVTIFGESAGSASVSLHLLSKLSRPYFKAAIMESGSALSPWSFVNDKEAERANSRGLGEAMECDVSSSAIMVECLRGKDAAELLTTAEVVYGGIFNPTLDGTFLEDTPDNLYQMGDFAKVPIIAGFNQDEGTLLPYFIYTSYIGSPSPPPQNRSVYLAAIQGQLDFYYNSDAILLDAIDQEYTDWAVADDPNADYFNEVVAFYGDLLFQCPTDYVARAQAAAGLPVYKYYMTHYPSQSYYEYTGLLPRTPWMGVAHAEELTFVFGAPFIEQLVGVKPIDLTDDEMVLSVQVMTLWTNFAKSGNPNKADDEAVESDFNWPEYTIPGLDHMELALGLPVGSAARARECHFWTEYFENLFAFTNDMDETEKEWRESYDDWKTDMADWQQTFEDYKQETTCN